MVFADIRDFTPLTTSLPPARVRELLDRYYEYLVAIIHRHRGTVMQFVGDEVFAVFGVPVADDTMATEALRSVRRNAGRGRRPRRPADGRWAAADPFGIGVHCGTVVAAHVGTENRRQYAVVGEAVNIGARLCDRAAAGEILVSDRAWSAAAAELRDHFVAAGSVELKGVAVPVAVYRSSPVTPYPSTPRLSGRVDKRAGGPECSEGVSSVKIRRNVASRGRAAQTADVPRNRCDLLDGAVDGRWPGARVAGTGSPRGRRRLGDRGRSRGARRRRRAVRAVGGGRTGCRRRRRAHGHHRVCRDRLLRRVAHPSRHRHRVRGGRVGQ